MATFALVHGAWLGAWCWDRVAVELKRAGHIALMPELPGRGQDQTPVAAISLDSYIQTINKTIDKVDRQVVPRGPQHWAGSSSRRWRNRCLTASLP